MNSKTHFHLFMTKRNHTSLSIWTFHSRNFTLQSNTTEFSKSTQFCTFIFIFYLFIWILSGKFIYTTIISLTSLLAFAAVFDHMPHHELGVSMKIFEYLRWSKNAIKSWSLIRSQSKVRTKVPAKQKIKYFILINQGCEIAIFVYNSTVKRFNLFVDYIFTRTWTPCRDLLQY